MTTKRMLQVGEQIREFIATMLVRGDIADPRLNNVTINSVAISADLQTAKIYFSAGENKKAEATKAFKKASGYIRKELGKVLHVRYTPELIFYYDDNLEHAFQINALLNKIQKES